MKEVNVYVQALQNRDQAEVDLRNFSMKPSLGTLQVQIITGRSNLSLAYIGVVMGKKVESSEQDTSRC